MNASLTAKITRGLSLAIGIVLVLLPFHAFLTAWLASGLGHYTLLRLWKELLLLVVGLVALVLLTRDLKMRRDLARHQLFWLIAVYIILQLFLGLTSYIHNQVSGEALAYGLLDDTRYILFFVLVAGVVSRDKWLRTYWKQLVLGPAAIVVVFGLLEILVLPHNFLQHFGYGPNTLPAIETVNSNSHYIRATSTLRGADPLGAYLVLIVAVLAVLGARAKVFRVRLTCAIGGIATLVLLFLSYSRGAWIGTGLALICIGFVTIKSKQLKQWLSLALVVLVIIGGLGVWSLHGNTHFDNVIFHTSPHSVATTSDQGHSSALRQGLNDLVHDPLGRGPGTAGPASAYNHKQPARIAENYFVQIGQELGWLGLALFLLINIILGIELWLHRTESLALIMFASLIGLSFVGLVSHVWADDTLSYIWWGLAGIALSPSLIKPEKKHA